MQSWFSSQDIGSSLIEFSPHFDTKSESEAFITRKTNNNIKFLMGGKSYVKRYRLFYTHLKFAHTQLQVDTVR